MHPFMLQTDVPGLGPLDVPSYFLLIMVAFLVGSSIGVREGRRTGYRVIDTLDLSLVMLVVGMIGARIAFVFLAAPDIELPVPKQSSEGWAHWFCRRAGENHLVRENWNLGRYYLLHPQAVFEVWNGGFVFYGGFLAVIPAGWWFCKRRGLDFWATADLVAPAGAVALAVGRVGCLLGGCCHGGPVDGPLSPLGLVFHRGVGAAVQGLSIWPTQVFETVAVLGITLGLVRMRRVKRFDGQVFLALMALYAIWRPVNELLRADDQRGVWFGLTTSQWISIGLLAAAALLFPFLWKRRPKPAAFLETVSPVEARA